MFARLTLASFLALWLAAVPSHALGDLFVDSVSGSDTTGDGSSGNPWRTITFALGQVPGSGDTIHVAAGLHDGALGEAFPLRMKPGVSLSGDSTSIDGAGAPEVIRFDASAGSFGSDTVLEGFRVQGGAKGIVCDGNQTGHSCSPTLQELELVGQSTIGIDVFGSGDPVFPVIRDCSVDQAGTGISVGYFNVTGALSIQDTRIRNCNVGVRVDEDATVSFIFVTVSIRRTEIRDCTTGVFATWVEGVAPIVLEDSLVAGCTVGVLGYATVVGTTHTIRRSTITDNGRGLVGDFFGTTYYKVENSIVWGNTTKDIDPLSSSIVVSWTDVSDPQYVGLNGNLDMDPLFVDVMSGDFHLSSASPLVDRGDRAHPPGSTDVDVDPRVLDGDADGQGRVDIGYDEYNLVRLDLTGTPALGATLTLAVTAPPGWLYLSALARATADVSLGGLGSILIDPVSLVFFGSGVAPASDSVGVPSNPSLSGLSLYFQSGAIDPSGLPGSMSNRAVAEIQ